MGALSDQMLTESGKQCYSLSCGFPSTAVEQVPRSIIRIIVVEDANEEDGSIFVTATGEGGKGEGEVEDDGKTSPS